MGTVEHAGTKVCEDDEQVTCEEVRAQATASGVLIITPSDEQVVCVDTEALAATSGVALATPKDVCVTVGAGDCEEDSALDATSGVL